MLGFISTIGNLITGAINDVKNWILRLIQAVYSFIGQEIDALGSELDSLWNEAVGLYHSVEQFAIGVYDTLSNAITTAYHDILQWAQNAINDVVSFVKSALQVINDAIDDIYHKILQVYDDIESWVMTHIWDPLYNFAMTAIHWIENEGTYLYDLVTHPEKLVALLAKYIWDAWLEIFKDAVQPIARWLLHTMLGLAGDLADVLETLLTALL